MKPGTGNRDCGLWNSDCGLKRKTEPGTSNTEPVTRKNKRTHSAVGLPSHRVSLCALRSHCSQLGATSACSRASYQHRLWRRLSKRPTPPLQSRIADHKDHSLNPADWRFSVAHKNAAGRETHRAVFLLGEALFVAVFNLRVLCVLCGNAVVLFKSVKSV